LISKEEPKLEDYKLEERKIKSKKFPELVRLIDHRAKDPKFTERKRYAHYASDTSKCMREQYLGRKGIVPTNPISEENRRRGRAGLIYEQWMKEDIKRAGFWAGEEVSFRSSDPETSVRVDVLFDMRVLRELFSHHRIELGLMRGLPSGDELIAPCEIKSVRQYAFEGGKNAVGYKDIPMWGHYCQTQLYLHMMGLEYGFMVYINREDASKSAHIIFRDEELCEFLVERQVMLDWFLSNDIMPEREGYIEFGARGGLKKSRRCGICNYPYYDFFEEIMENGTKSEKTKMLRALEELPEEQLTSYMREALGIDDKQ
jgi:hypothetical protein